MGVRKVFAVAATAVAAVAVGVIALPAHAEVTGGARIMPLGDSITDGFNVPGGYRTNLYKALAAAGHFVDFVGSAANGPADLPDHDHEGHPGWRIDQVDAQVKNWITNTSPRTILLHLGTNDINQNFDVANAPARLSTLIDHVTEAAPTADVFIASIIVEGDPALDAKANAFNAALPAIMGQKLNAGKRVHFVDMHPVLTPADLADGVHPTRAGYDKMAAKWASALASVPGSAGDDGAGISVPTGLVSLRVTTNGLTDRYARHENSLGYIAQVGDGSSALLKQDATWKIVGGLAGNCYSLQSRNYPSYYLRHASGRVQLSTDDGSALMHSDATWCARQGAGGGVRFSAYAYPSSYLRHFNGALYLATAGAGDAWNNANSFVPDITWSLESPWAP